MDVLQHWQKNSNQTFLSEDSLNFSQKSMWGSLNPFWQSRKVDEVVLFTKRMGCSKNVAISFLVYFCDYDCPRHRICQTEHYWWVQWQEKWPIQISSYWPYLVCKKVVSKKSKVCILHGAWGCIIFTQQFSDP